MITTERKDLLTEDEVTLTNLINILKSAYIDVQDVNLDEQEFKVKIDNAKINISLDTNKDIISFAVHITDTFDEIKYQKCLATINKVNLQYLLVRPCIISNEKDMLLIIECCIPCNYGIIVPQFIHLLKRFRDISIKVYLEEFGGILN